MTLHLSNTKLLNTFFFSEGDLGLKTRQLTSRVYSSTSISIYIADLEIKVTSHSWTWTLLFWCARSRTFLNKPNLPQKPHKIMRIKSITWSIKKFKISYFIHYRITSESHMLFLFEYNLKYIKKYLLLCCLFAFLFLNVLLRSVAEILSWHTEPNHFLRRSAWGT